MLHGARVLLQCCREFGGLLEAAVGGTVFGRESMSALLGGEGGPTFERRRIAVIHPGRARAKESANSHLSILTRVQIARLLIRLQRPLEIPSLLRQDDGNLLLPVGGLTELALLLVELDGALQCGNGHY